MTQLRPWGEFRVLLEGPYLVKVITVKPGARLSLQAHRHRDEFWTVASGSGVARVGELCDIALRPGVQVAVPAGVLHRIQAAARETLEIIEVQIGPLLSEEDIERFADDYGRDPEKDDEAGDAPSGDDRGGVCSAGRDVGA